MLADPGGADIPGSAYFIYKGCNNRNLRTEEWLKSLWKVRMKIFEIIAGICILVVDVLVAVNQFMKVMDIFTGENAE